MTVTQVLGAKVQPTFADPAEWNNTRTYAPLTIVLHEGNSYTSAQYVPMGIDISNEKFWKLTGNYNSQVEQYRKEVATYDGRITTNANDIATEVSNRIAADSTLTNAMLSHSSLLHYGSISFTDKYPELDNPQGMCIKDDKLIFVTTNSDTNNSCIVFTVNKQTGVIEKTTSVEWGHCNGIAYDNKADVLYVCPNKDYTNDGAAVSEIIIANATTYETIKTISFSVTPHSIAVDRITNECFMTEETSSGIKVYKVNTTNWNIDYKFTLTTSNLNFANASIGSVQTIRSYNGNLWFLYGGRTNTLVNFDSETGVIKNVINDLYYSYIYELREMESFDFTDDGDIYIWSFWSYLGRFNQGIISMLNLYGNKCVDAREFNESATYQLNAILDTSIDNSVCKLGTADAPFTNIFDCIESIRFNKTLFIVINSDYVIPAAITSIINLRFAINNCKLTLNNITAFNTEFIRQGGTATLVLNNNVLIRGKVHIENISVEGEGTLKTYDLLTCRSVTGGTFSGEYSAGLFKSNDCTGTFTNFMSPSA